MGDSNDMSGSPRRKRARLECLERELAERLCAIQGLQRRVEQALDGKCNEDNNNGGAPHSSTSHGEQSHQQHPQPSDCVKLNVGGTVFTTLLSTLTSVPNTYFESLFSGRWVLRPQADGCFFIDRDPLVFAHIINFLRGQSVPDFSELSPRELQLLRNDAAFYNISPLLGIIPPPPVPPVSEKFCRYAKFDDEFGESVTISERGTFAGAFLAREELPEIHPYSQLGGAVLGTNTYSGDDHVVIKLRVEQGCGSGVFVGFFAPDSPLSVEESRVCVWGAETSEDDPMQIRFTRFTEGDEVEAEFDGPKGMVRVRCVRLMLEEWIRLDDAAERMFGEPGKAVNWRLYVRLHHSRAVRLVDAYRVTQ